MIDAACPNCGRRVRFTFYGLVISPVIQLRYLTWRVLSLPECDACGEKVMLPAWWSIVTAICAFIAGIAVQSSCGLREPWAVLMGLSAFFVWHMAANGAYVLFGGKLVMLDDWP